MSEGGGRRAIIAAFLANLGIAIAKFVGFAFTGSTSLLAEGIHSVADTGNQGLLMLGSARSRREPTPEHPFGYGRERYFWAFVVAIVLFTLGSVFAIFEGAEKIIHPHEVESIGWAIGILLVSIVFEAASLRTAVREARSARRNTSFFSFIRRSKAPEIPVVLLEDTAALAGLTFALIAVVLTKITGDAVWDGIGTVCIGVLLGVVATVLAIEMKSLLIGESASRDDVEAIRSAVLSSPDVRTLIHLRTEHFGPEDLLVGMKVQFRADLSFDELARAIDDVEERVRAVVPIARPMYIEPDVFRAGTV